MNTNNISRLLPASMLLVIIMLQGCGGTGPATRAAQAGRLPEQVLRDPAERTMVMHRMSMDIIRKSRGIPEERYQAAVRPRLEAQLLRLGLAQEDADFVLADVDRSRTGRRAPATAVTYRSR
jgi:hypothetical protein